MQVSKRTSVDLVGILAELFVHRKDAYATQYFNKSLNSGGYVKATRQTCVPRCSNQSCEHSEPLTLMSRDIEQHLMGVQTIGVYQLGEGDTVKWICFDVDKDKTVLEDVPAHQIETNAKEQVKGLVSTCIKNGIKPLVENSAGRGYHVWIPFTQPVPANLALAVATGIMRNIKELPNIHIEVFPKQVGTKSLGSLVKLPLGINKKSGKTSVFINKEFEPIHNQGEYLSRAWRMTKEDAEEFVAKNKVPLIPLRNIEEGSDVGKYIPLCLVNGLEDGVADGIRDVFTFRLACYLRDRGIPQELTETMLIDWNERNSPPLGNSTLLSKVRSAYSQSYSYLPCRDPSFNRLCKSSCDFYKRKLAWLQGPSEDFFS